jgi:sialate O-acetylesterase
MVVQRQVKVPVWGFADPGTKVSVAFAGQTLAGTTDANGRWQVTLDPLEASDQPREMTIASGPQRLTIKNVLVGEVWLASGQSNMELSVTGARNASPESAAANFPQIRMFTVTKAPAPAPLDRCAGSWAVCSPQTVGGFSAAGYYFARELYQKLHVPIGVIHSSWGATAAQPWTPLAALRGVPSLQPSAAAFDKLTQQYSSAEYRQNQDKSWQQFDRDNAAWLADAVQDDPGLKGKWFEAQTDASPQDWKALRLPNELASNPWYFLGIAWLRKPVEIPAAWVGKDLTLQLGVVVGADATYVNGTQVGGLWFGTDGHATTPRQYQVPAALVTSTKLLLAVRVMNVFRAGGMVSPREQLALRCPSLGPDAKITLAGNWQSRVAKTFSRANLPRPEKMPTPFLPDLGVPSSLYNGMIAPLIPYALRGAIWYQGESNGGEPEVYRDLFPAMIQSWRQAWGQGDFPFYYVQLAAFTKPQTAAIENKSWAELREAQTATLALPNTGMVVATDIGDAGIHPPNKQEVGRRLALWALANAYGQKLEYSGPLYKSMAVRDSAIEVAFDHVGGGLVAKGTPLVGFAIAGADKVFHVAQAKIDGSNVRVWSDKVAAPVAVRYAWAQYPVCNLYNQAGLPASPFRTDTWKSGEAKPAAGEIVSAPAAP